MIDSFSAWVSDTRVKRGLWIAGGILFLLSLALGGAPWHRDFWIALAVIIGVTLPFIGTALFLWQRER